MPDAVKPIPSASILLVRDSRAGLEVLMQERPKTMKFAPGAFVFPGGKVDRIDASYPADAEDAALRVSAIRELYEEAGVLLCDRLPSNFARHDTPEDFMADIMATKTTLCLSDLVLFANWVTPEVVPMRYDTYFYLAHDKHTQAVVPDMNETVSTHWVNPHKMLNEWEDDQVPLMFPTRLNLVKLARWNTVTEAMEAAAALPVSSVLPSLTVVDGLRTVSIPKEAGYGVTTASQREMGVEAPKKR